MPRILTDLDILRQQQGFSCAAPLRKMRRFANALEEPNNYLTVCSCRRVYCPEDVDGVEFDDPLCVAVERAPRIVTDVIADPSAPKPPSPRRKPRVDTVGFTRLPSSACTLCIAAMKVKAVRIENFMSCAPAELARIRIHVLNFPSLSSSIVKKPLNGPTHWRDF